MHLRCGRLERVANLHDDFRGLSLSSPGFSGYDDGLIRWFTRLRDGVMGEADSNPARVSLIYISEAAAWGPYTT